MDYCSPSIDMFKMDSVLTKLKTFLHPPFHLVSSFSLGHNQWLSWDFQLGKITVNY